MLNVLLVEDQKDSRLLFEQTLVSRGHTVTVCEDTETAWTAYQRDHYPLVLLGLGLPGSTIDGLQLCRSIRAHGRGSYSIIVMTTAHNVHDDLPAMLEAGANDYLTKPISLDVLTMRLSIAEQWAIAESVALDLSQES